MGAELKKIWVTMITGWSDPAPTIDLARKAQQVVADQEWEDEGGSIKPEKSRGQSPKSKAIKPGL